MKPLTYFSRLPRLSRLACQRPPSRLLLVALAVLLALSALSFGPHTTFAATRYSFEDGSLQGWTTSGSIGSIANSTDYAYRGSHALKVVLASTSYSAAGFARVNPQGTIGQGDTLEAYVYASTSGSTTAAFLVQDQAYHQTLGPNVPLAAGWTHLTYTVPSGATLPLRLVGLQFGATTLSSATLYLDEVGTVGSASPPTSTPTKSSTPAPARTNTPMPSRTPASSRTHAPAPTNAPAATRTPAPTNPPQPTSTPSAPTASGSVSRLIWGVNFDYRIQSNPALASSLHVRSVRIDGNNANWQSWLSIAKAQGWTPLVILRNCGVADLNTRIATDKSIVQAAVSIWGSSSGLYFELGNENDLQCGWSAATYTSSWNSVVPQLKSVAPSAKYGGPINYQRNPAYIATFVHTASPRPDFISWHEYTCPSSAAASTCMNAIANIPTHVRDTVAAIQQNGDSVPPIALTEWNYAPDGSVTTDAKATDSHFMYSWTKAFLDAVTAPSVSQYVFMTDIFNVSDNTPLYRNSTVSGQGQAFSDLYVQYFGTK